MGSSTGQVIAQALEGGVPEYLARLEAEAAPDEGAGAEIRGLLRGDLHLHSDWSDGRLSIPDMAEAARAMGFAYLGLCDHSQSAGYARGLSTARVREQHAAIDALNRRIDGAFRLLKGS